MKRFLKRALFSGFCWGVLPAWFVVAGFRAFDLGGV